MFLLIREMSLIDAAQPTGAWYERVASSSNVADLPSRGEHMKACELVRGVPKGDITLSHDMLARLQTRSFDEFLALLDDAQPRMTYETLGLGSVTNDRLEHPWIFNPRLRVIVKEKD